MKLRLLLPAALAMGCCACVTHIRPDVTSNPPPALPLSTFQHFMLDPVTALPDAAAQTAAMAKISANVQQKLGETIAPWENRNTSGRTLVIHPRIVELKFVGGGKRFFAGAMAGSSAVIMRLRLTDGNSGKLIADPEFYQRAAAMGGTRSFGGTDDGMLVRIATAAQQYMQRNYATAVGGPTGLDGSAE
jgi:hypothetical protein